MIRLKGDEDKSLQRAEISVDVAKGHLSIPP